MAIPVLIQSLKSSMLSTTSHQMDKTSWAVVCATVEQVRSKAKGIAQKRSLIQEKISFSFSLYLPSFSRNVWLATNLIAIVDGGATVVASLLQKTPH